MRRKSVKKVEEDMKQLEAVQAVCGERRTDGGLQDQVRWEGESGGVS